MSFFCCDDGCIKVELALQGDRNVLNCTEEQYDDLLENDYDRREISDTLCDHLRHFKCFQDAVIGYDCGHINYSVASYCVQNGHLNCLKYLHQNGGLHWHTDLAMVAIEHSQLSCLKYIVEFMGSYCIDFQYDNKQSVGECMEYAITTLPNIINKKMPKI